MFVDIDWQYYGEYVMSLWPLVTLSALIPASHLWQEIKKPSIIK